MAQSMIERLYALVKAYCLAYCIHSDICLDICYDFRQLESVQPFGSWFGCICVLPSMSFDQPTVYVLSKVLSQSPKCRVHFVYGNSKISLKISVFLDTTLKRQPVFV